MAKTVAGVEIVGELKKYQLTSLAEPFARRKAKRELTEGPTVGVEADEEVDVYQFRIRYGVDRVIGKKTVRVIKALRKCPIISIPLGGIVQTENPEAQQYLELHRSPNKTERNGSKRADGLMFREYTGAEEADVDLDLHLV